MFSHSLPERLNLAHLKHQAKDLLKSHRSADADALARIVSRFRGAKAMLSTASRRASFS